MRSRILLDPAPTDGGGAPGTPPALADALQALLSQFQGGQNPPAEPPPATPPPAAEKGKGEAPPADVYAYLQDLQRKVEERDAAEKSKADADAVTKLQKQVESLVGAGDAARLRDGLQKLQDFFAGK